MPEVNPTRGGGWSAQCTAGCKELAPARQQKIQLRLLSHRAYCGLDVHSIFSRESRSWLPHELGGINPEVNTPWPLSSMINRQVLQECYRKITIC